MKTLLIFLTFLSLPNVCLAEDSGQATVKQTLMTRALHAMQIVPSFKQGVKLEKTRSGKTSPSIEFILNADDAKLEAVFLWEYSKHLSTEQMEEIVRFYESPNGKALIAQQVQDLNNPNPPLQLNPSQMTQARAFSGSATGLALQQLMQSEAVWSEVNAALKLLIPR